MNIHDCHLHSKLYVVCVDCLINNKNLVTFPFNLFVAEVKKCQLASFESFTSVCLDYWPLNCKQNLSITKIVFSLGALKIEKYRYNIGFEPKSFALEMSTMFYNVGNYHPQIFFRNSSCLNHFLNIFNKKLFLTLVICFKTGNTKQWSISETARSSNSCYCCRIFSKTLLQIIVITALHIF